MQMEMEGHEHGIVGKCMVASCAWQNNDMCNAPGVSVGQWKQNHDCVTWIPEEEL